MTTVDFIGPGPAEPVKYSIYYGIIPDTYLIIFRSAALYQLMHLSFMMLHMCFIVIYTVNLHCNWFFFNILLSSHGDPD